MKELAKKALKWFKNNVYELTYDYDWDENLVVDYNSYDEKFLSYKSKPIEYIINYCPIWTPFTVDEDGLLNCPLPEIGEDILISDGDIVIIDSLESDGENYYLDRTNWELIGLAWMALPKPYDKYRDLAIKLDRFSEEVDYYEYNDNIDNNIDYVEILASQLKEGYYEPIINFLEELIAEGGPVELAEDAQELIKEIENLYKK